ncbi:methyltransferase C-terminal domain-containing protein [Oceanisphaera sediminis]|uniref:Methyltransferase C-terminal domain-containing protein n=1 Tax=Oceanisphaera sediminis TaxID=981381 RepID=A0ABP7ED30_9GAMM
MKCRHCQHELTLSFLDLGSAPPSNAYLTAEQLATPETWYPLHILVCEACWLVQTEDHAQREQLFDADYAYFSSFSRSWLDHARRYVDDMIGRFGLTTAQRVVEVAANDGYLLQYVQAAGLPCYGIEPTASTARAARDKGLTVVEDFFGRALARRLADEGQQANLMVANNVLAHVPDINDFVAGFPLLLTPDGVATFEFPHLLNLVQQNQFDTIYHEHYSYLSLTAVERIFQQHGLTVFDVESLPTHGGSLRVFAQRTDTGQRTIEPAVAHWVNCEEQAGIRQPAFYAGLQQRAEHIKHELLAFLLNAKRQGCKVAAYGAAAKGNTLLNFAGVRPDLLPYVVDLNPAKQGKFMPGSRIPIVAEQHLLDDQPDYVLLLPWNLRDELIQQLDAVRQWGSRFVVAIPALTVHGTEQA